jgi:hypothetical protein
VRVDQTDALAATSTGTSRMVRTAARTVRSTRPVYAAEDPADFGATLVETRCRAYDVGSGRFGGPDLHLNRPSKEDTTR